MFLPFRGKNRLTSGFRLADRPAHNGIDLVGEDDPSVYSPVNGTVRRTANIPKESGDPTWEWGNYIRLDDEQGNRLYFCHLASWSVKEGQSIKAGDKLGIMGNTGLSFGAHLHFEVRDPDNKTHKNPALYLGIRNQPGTYGSPNGWVLEKGFWRWYEWGQLQKNMWVSTDGWWYYVGESGEMKVGIELINGKLYYFNEKKRHDIPLGACLITNAKGEIQS